MKIKDIRHIETNETRTDGRYPLRIGSTVDFYSKPFIGFAMMLAYVADNEGNPKEGILRTSYVKEYTENEKEFIVKTNNSIYILEK